MSSLDRLATIFTHLIVAAGLVAAILAVALLAYAIRRDWKQNVQASVLLDLFDQEREQ